MVGQARKSLLWKMSLNGKPAPKVAGFTGEQQFFLAFDQSWRQVRRDASLRRGVLTTEHAVEPGQALYLPPDQRTPVW